MNAKVLAGAFGVILLTASVVVGFLNHAAYNAQKVSNHRGRRHSFGQGALSAGSSDYVDLSSILESAKSELGAASSSAASTATSAPKIAETVTSAVTEAPIVPEAVQSAATAAATAAASVNDGTKAPTLANFIKDSASRPGVTNDWSNTRAGLKLLKDNSIRLTGRDPADIPDIKLPDVQAGYYKVAGQMPQVSLKEIGEKAKNIDLKDVAEKAKNIDLEKVKDIDLKSSLSSFSLPAIEMPAIEWPTSFDAASIQQFIEHLPPATKSLAAVAAGVTVLLIGAASKKPKEIKAASSKDIDATTAKVSGLTDELGSLQSRMKALEATGYDLDNQLKEAKQKLTEKELDISKARLKAADTSLSLQREIDTLKQKLLENDGKVKNMDAELSKARDECVTLVAKLEKGKKTEEDKVKALADQAAKVEKLKKEAEAAKKKEAEAARKMALEAAKKADEEGKKKAAAKKAAPKKAAPKKAAPKKTVTKAKTEELPTADAPPKKAAAPKKAAPKKKAAAKKAASKDLTELTPSALSRTTVKVLVEFLSEKGIDTVGEDGKTKKKADLIEAVKSL